MDTVAEFLTRIRNASKAGHDKVDVPSSNVRKGLANVLQEAGYIRNYKVVADGRQGMMRVYLKYAASGSPVIEKLKTESKPGRRVYVNVDKIPKVRSGYGIAILSTNKGILSSLQAKKQNVGGELLCTVW
jgi:small subunit ribosomal protein S8